MKDVDWMTSTPVFRYFADICAIPHGSGDMDAISAYCMRFAQEHGLQAVCDEAKNVSIYKPGTAGYEEAAPVILQGHLDMVCQKQRHPPSTSPRTGWMCLQTGILSGREAPLWVRITGSQWR